MHSSYRDPACTLTLREGLEEYFSNFEGRFDPDERSTAEVGEMFRCHDAAHIVFGTSTELHDETLTDTWTVSATDIRMKDALAYMKAQESADILGELGAWALLSTTVKAVPDIIRVLARARRMSGKWSWYGWRDHLDRRLCDIRAELGLDILGARGEGEAEQVSRSA